MSDRFKYAKNGIWKIENFLGRIGWNDSIMKPIGRLAGEDNWLLILRTEETDYGTMIRPYIQNPFLLENEEKFGIRIFFNIYNSNENLKNVFRSEGFYVMNFPELSINMQIDLLDLMNLGNGLLENEALFVEFGVHVDSKFEEKIWKFNFSDTIFDKSVNNGFEMITGNENRLACHEQLLQVHAPFLCSNTSFDDRKKPMKLKYGRKCLQILHGVQLKLSKLELVEVIEIAIYFKARNVLHYCENQLIENSPPISNFKVGIRFAINFGFRRLLDQLLKNNKEIGIEKLLEGFHIKKMSGETMKLLIWNFLYNRE